MLKKHINLRDVGLASRRLVGNTLPIESLLPCGRLLRCGVIDGCSFDELRRPRTIINLRMGEESHVDDSLSANGVVMLHEPAENRLEKYNTSNIEVRTWLQSVISIFSRGDIEYPVLVHCRSGKDRTGVVVVALLLLLGYSENLVVREFLLSEGAEEKNIRLALSGFNEVGGINEYLSMGGAVDVEGVRARLMGHPSLNDRLSQELTWLQQEVSLMCNLARNATQRLEEQEATFWSSAVIESAEELACRLPLGEAAAAHYCRGWALGQLHRHEEACEALSIGIALARQGEAKPQVLKKLEKELAMHGDEICVLDVTNAADAPGDPHVDLVLLDSVGEGLNGYRHARACPKAFSWLRCGELALSTTPESRHLDALDCLCLSHHVSAEPSLQSQSSEDHLQGVLQLIADGLSCGKGCLVHCEDGFSVVGVVGACFLVIYGLDRPVRKGSAGQPQMTAGEAIELVRLWRPGSLTSVDDEEQVQQFAQSAWAKHVEKTQRAFCVSSTTNVKKMAPPNARVVKQPPDGNCLFHSLSHALGGSAQSLRGDVCLFMEKQPDLIISGTSLADWIQMLAGVPVAQYVKKMSKTGNWGGAPEIAVCAHMRQVNIHVYEKRNGEFERTVPFDVGASRTISVLYVGGVHYDALVLP